MSVLKIKNILMILGCVNTCGTPQYVGEFINDYKFSNLYVACDDPAKLNQIDRVVKFSTPPSVTIENKKIVTSESSFFYVVEFDENDTNEKILKAFDGKDQMPLDASRIREVLRLEPPKDSSHAWLILNAFMLRAKQCNPGKGIVVVQPFINY